MLGLPALVEARGWKSTGRNEGAGLGLPQPWNQRCSIGVQTSPGTGRAPSWSSTKLADAPLPGQSDHDVHSITTDTKDDGVSQQTRSHGERVTFSKQKTGKSKIAKEVTFRVPAGKQIEHVGISPGNGGTSCYATAIRTNPGIAGRPNGLNTNGSVVDSEAIGGISIDGNKMKLVMDVASNGKMKTNATGPCPEQHGKARPFYVTQSFRLPQKVCNQCGRRQSVLRNASACLERQTLRSNISSPSTPASLETPDKHKDPKEGIFQCSETLTNRDRWPDLVKVNPDQLTNAVRTKTITITKATIETKRDRDDFRSLKNKKWVTMIPKPTILVLLPQMAKAKSNSPHTNPHNKHPKMAYHTTPNKPDSQLLHSDALQPPHTHYTNTHRANVVLNVLGTPSEMIPTKECGALSSQKVTTHHSPHTLQTNTGSGKSQSQHRTPTSLHPVMNGVDPSYQWNTSASIKPPSTLLAMPDSTELPQAARSSERKRPSLVNSCAVDAMTQSTARSSPASTPRLVSQKDAQITPADIQSATVEPHTDTRAVSQPTAIPNSAGKRLCTVPPSRTSGTANPTYSSNSKATAQEATPSSHSQTLTPPAKPFSKSQTVQTPEFAPTYNGTICTIMPIRSPSDTMKTSPSTAISGSQLNLTTSAMPSDPSLMPQSYNERAHNVSNSPITNYIQHSQFTSIPKSKTTFTVPTDPSSDTSNIAPPNSEMNSKTKPCLAKNTSEVNLNNEPAMQSSELCQNLAVASQFTWHENYITEIRSQRSLLWASISADQQRHGPQHGSRETKQDADSFAHKHDKTATDETHSNAWNSALGTSAGYSNTPAFKSSPAQQTHSNYSAVHSGFKGKTNRMSLMASEKKPPTYVSLRAGQQDSCTNMTSSSSSLSSEISAHTNIDPITDPNPACDSTSLALWTHLASLPHLHAKGIRPSFRPGPPLLRQAPLDPKPEHVHPAAAVQLQPPPAQCCQSAALWRRLEGVKASLAANQDRISTLLSIINDLEVCHARTDGYRHCETGQELTSCSTCQKTACAVYNVEYEFRQQERRLLEVLNHPAYETHAPSQHHSLTVLRVSLLSNVTKSKVKSKKLCKTLFNWLPRRILRL